MGLFVMDESILKCGFLTKKGAFKVGGWKKRWFVLRSDARGGNAVLAYYRKQTDADPAGEINLDQSTLAYHNVDADKPFAFNIQTKGRTVCFLFLFVCLFFFFVSLAHFAFQYE